MKILKAFSLFTFASLIITQPSYSQNRYERRDMARIRIDSLFSSAKAIQFRTDEIIDVDSSIGESGIADGKITDPYGTLKRCYIFMATTDGEQGEDRKHSIGIYRDRQIIWTSGQLPGSEHYGYITDEGFLATKDLNRKGKVDIVVYFSDGTNPPSAYYLWIISWDGNKGEYINQRETNGATAITSNGAFEIADVDKDGIDEIRAFSGNDDSVGANGLYKLKIDGIYKWNGSVYALEKTKTKKLK
jgi:hypothetical protein